MNAQLYSKVHDKFARETHGPNGVFVESPNNKFISVTTEALTSFRPNYVGQIYFLFSHDWKPLSNTFSFKLDEFFYFLLNSFIELEALSARALMR